MRLDSDQDVWLFHGLCRLLSDSSLINTWPSGLAEAEARMQRWSLGVGLLGIPALQDRWPCVGASRPWLFDLKRTLPAPTQEIAAKLREEGDLV